MPGVRIANASVEGYTRSEALQELEGKINRYFDISIQFEYGDYTYETKLGDISRKPNLDEIVADVWQKEQKRSIYHKAINIDGAKLTHYPIKVSLNDEVVADLVKTWNSNIAIDYVNASLQVDKEQGLIVTPSVSGQAVDINATLENLPLEIMLDNIIEEYEVPIVLQEIRPEVIADDLRNMGELATYTTWYKVAEIDRSHNLKISSDSINGTILFPEEIFSFNEVVGKRSYATGYRDAMVIVGGLFEPGLGGGICQVSSTIYNTALLAGMEIVERHNHALAVAYIPLGQDATVTYGIQDFRFKNNTKSPIYIQSFANNGKLTITIYGDISYKQKIEVSHVVDNVIAYTEVEKIEENMAEDEVKVETYGAPGYVVRSFRTFYDNNGNKIRTENLATDRYLPLNKVVKMGPKKEDGEVSDNNEIIDRLPPVSETGKKDREAQEDTKNEAANEGEENNNAKKEEAESNNSKPPMGLETNYVE